MKNDIKYKLKINCKKNDDELLHNNITIIDVDKGQSFSSYFDIVNLLNSIHGDYINQMNITKDLLRLIDEFQSYISQQEYEKLETTCLKANDILYISGYKD